jgi:23S rRNA-/tRNA-specific pseudouridylate synthase
MLLHVARAAATSLLLLPASTSHPTSTLRLCCPPTMSGELIIHQGEDFLVVNKPPGVIVHDGDDSLLRRLEALGHTGYDSCHRLDAETSGVLLCAKKGATGRLHKALAHESTTKRYRGVVRGIHAESLILFVWLTSQTTRRHEHCAVELAW